MSDMFRASLKVHPLTQVQVAKARRLSISKWIGAIRRALTIAAAEVVRVRSAIALSAVKTVRTHTNILAGVSMVRLVAWMSLVRVDQLHCIKYTIIPDYWHFCPLTSLLLDDSMITSAWQLCLARKPIIAAPKRP